MKYFAYGSNMDSERMKKRGVNFHDRKHAILKNYILQFNKVASANAKEGKANIVKREGIVEGAIYELNSSDTYNLDCVEGYPDHYDRKNITVQLDDGSQVEAIAYIAQPAKIKNDLKPTKEYLSHLLAGRDILSAPYYENLRSEPTLD